ncbi:MAG: lytic transglycosylase domain-containing protein [Sphingobium sp.]
MALSAAAIFALASQCAPNVAPQTVAAIVQTESRGRPFALNVNGGSQPPEQTDALSAAATARGYVAAGYSVDLGLGQVNSRNMRALGLTWETVFDPCTNIAALGRVLTQNYSAAINGRDPQDALRVALSLYNTGSALRGFNNGYVAKVVRNAGFATEPSASPLPLSEMRVSVIAENSGPVASPAVNLAGPPAWNLFERAAHQRRVASASSVTGGTSVWTD